ncbi:MAG: 2-hydroxyacyl-CoA dehydratase subunit D [Candidatus Anammoxibacter sp.]
MEIKNNLKTRFAPIIFRELLRFFYFKDFLPGPKEKFKSLDFTRRAVLKKLLDAYRFPKKTIWTTLFIPSEILSAMNINPFCMEIAASLFSKIGLSQKALLEAEAHGIPTDGCSFHRAALGYVLKNFYPKAQHIATTTSLCDNNPKTIGISQSITGLDSTILDVPYDLDDDAISYLAVQMKNFTKDLEKSFGVTMNIDKLKERIECSNRTRLKMIEVNQLRMDPDCPLAGSDALGLIVNSHLLCGTDDGETFYDMLAEDLKSATRTEKNREKSHDEKKLNILWLELKPYFSGDLLTNMENELGIKIVFEEINYVYWDEMDPDKPYESLARKMISNNNNGPLENRLKVLKMLIKQYNVEGMMMFASWGCRRNGAAVPRIKDELNKIGIPSLILHGDCIDDSTYTEGQFATRVEGFVEMLRSGSRDQVTHDLQEEVVNC